MSNKELSEVKDNLVELIKELKPNLELGIVKLSKYGSYRLIASVIILLLVLFLIGFLSFNKLIDNSATTALLGAIIGYTFGHFFNKGKN